MSNDMFICIHHIRNLQEDFKVQFKYLRHKEIPELIISPKCKFGHLSERKIYWNEYQNEVCLYT